MKPSNRVNITKLKEKLKFMEDYADLTKFGFSVKRWKEYFADKSIEAVMWPERPKWLEQELGRYTSANTKS